MPTDPKPTTFAALCALPGWIPNYVDPGGDYSTTPPHDGAEIVGADYVFGVHRVTAIYDHEGEQSGWCSLSDGLSVNFREESDEQTAVEWLLGMRALIEHAGAVALAAAAPPTPPTTIAELAARPGWILEGHNAYHVGGNVLATANLVEARDGKIGWYDEQECAELAFAVAEITTRAQARYAAANPSEG